MFGDELSQNIRNIAWIKRMAVRKNKRKFESCSLVGSTSSSKKLSRSASYRSEPLNFKHRSDPHRAWGNQRYGIISSLHSSETQRPASLLSVYFETPETKPTVYPNKVSEEIYPKLLSLFYYILIFVSITEQYSHKYILFYILPRATGQVRYNYWKRLELTL